MYRDPIVTEVREAGAKLAAEAGYDVHRFFERLRRAAARYDNPLVGKPAAGHGKPRLTRQSRRRQRRNV